MRVMFLVASLAVTMCAVGAEPSSVAPVRIPTDVFAGEPRGPWKTGTFEELWVDTQRDETTTSDPTDKRHLMIQVWYPTASSSNAAHAPYVLHRELYPDDELERWLDHAKHVRTTSVLNAPLAAQSERFPVLIYNPGGFHPHFSATFQTEYLASHGYVVVAIGHTGLTRIERFPDGYEYRPDHDEPFVFEDQTKGLTEVERFRLRRRQYSELLMPIHIKDIGFVLDRLQALNAARGSRFYGRLDLERVGSLGFSLGGALSMQASRDEPRVKAAVNQDGWLYTDVAETGTRRPVMQIYGDPWRFVFDRSNMTAASIEVDMVANALKWQFYDRSGADWYDVALRAATHGHFTDRTLFEPVVAEEMHPRLAHDIVNRLTLEFFDKYLRQSTHTPLLSGQQRYADVMIRSGSPGAASVDDTK